VNKCGLQAQKVLHETIIQGCSKNACYNTQLRVWKEQGIQNSLKAPAYMICFMGIPIYRQPCLCLMHFNGAF